MTDLLGPKGKQIEDHSLEILDLPLGDETGQMIITAGNVFQIKKHSDLTEIEGIHQLHNFNFTSIADMNSATVDATDIGKIAKVDKTFYMLSGVSPSDWRPILTSQNIEGGAPDTIYTPTQYIDCGIES